MTKVSLKFIVVILTTLSIISGCDKPEPAVETWPHTAIGMLDASISSDGRFALVSSVNHGAGYWDLEANQLKFEWKHHDNPEDGIIATDISPDGKRAITADKTTFVIWNTESGKAYGYWKAPSDIRAVAISDFGRYVLLGLGSGLAVHIDLNTGRRLEFTGHRLEAVASVDLSANGVWAFTGGNDYRAVMWNSKTGKPRFVFEHKTRVTQLRLDDNGEVAFTSGTKGNAHVWDLKTGAKKISLQLKPREYVISSVDFSHDNQWLITGAPGRDIILWSTIDGRRLKTWKATTRNQWKPSGAIVYAVGFHQDGKHIISEASSGFGQKWKIKPINPSKAPWLTF